MKATNVARRVGEWRERAAEFRVYGVDGIATVFERLADELESALRADAAELLTLEQAATACGLSADHVGRMVRAGKIPNAGRLNAPLVRQGDLPDPRRRMARGASMVYDVAADARSLRRRRGEQEHG